MSGQSIEFLDARDRQRFPIVPRDRTQEMTPACSFTTAIGSLTNVAKVDRQRRNRIVIETPSARYRQVGRPYRRPAAPGTREGVVALSVIAAAALATFLALFLTSRPYDPMDSTVEPQQVVPQGPTAIQPSPKPSPSTTPRQSPNATPEQPSEPAGGTAPPDDAAIQSEIERTLASDAVLSRLDVSTIVDAGKVTMVGSVKSSELKQRVEKAVRSVGGVSSVDNQLVVLQPTP